MDPYLGEIRIVPFNFAPVGWAMCDGQILPISQYTALFSLLGTYYGGNGTSNFALPNLQARVPLDYGNGLGLTPYALGETGGTPNVTLITNQIGGHTHYVMGTTAVANELAPAGNVVYAEPPGTGRNPSKLYEAGAVTTPVTLDGSVIGPSAGGSLPHNNEQPYLVLNFIIALQGIFPPRQ